MASDGEISCANDPNFAVIYSFLKVFGKLYGLEVPSLAKLQEYIENTHEVLEPLKELHLRLLRRALKAVLSSRWEKGLIKFCHQQGHHQEAWEIERFSYKKSSTQVKLGVLKLLLEYQFTCHPKFKTAVNAISCQELRLNPIGKDKNGCVYWLEVDNDANLCLFKEDQDEETWQLVARNREELVKVIEQLKTGEEVCPLNTSNVNEDSSSAEITTKEPEKSEVDEDNEEEFLSPESESDNESEEKKIEVLSQEEEIIGETLEPIKEEKSEDCDNQLSETLDNHPKNASNSTKQEKVTENPEDSKDVKDLGEVIEEPVMIITGEGNGVECDSSYIGEEIIEDFMYFYGEGSGYDNDTGNPELIEQPNSPNHQSDDENANEECVNGEHELNSSKSKLEKGVQLKSSLPSVNKRAMKKQINDTSEVLNPESKKHCVRELEKLDSSNSVTKSSDNELSKEANAHDKITTDSENCGKNHLKKGRSKVKKKISRARQLKIKKNKEIINSISETDNGHDSKTSIIEKRKSSVSSEENEEIYKSDNDKEKSPVKELKVEEPLPPKKLRLETTPESDVKITHSKANLTDSLEKKDNKDISNDSISQRKKIKASKGKFKRKSIINSSDNKCNKDKMKDSSKKICKSLKRSLLDSAMSEKNKTESQSDSEDNIPVVASGKRLKIKPKKIMRSSRKKVEEKLNQKHSSDESDDETLYSLAGKKTTKRILKKKPKNIKHNMEQDKKSSSAAADDNTPQVRTSRRIALMKIKEQSQSKTEESTVQDNECDKENKRKIKEEEEWRDSDASSSEGEKAATVDRGRRRAWRGSASSGPEPDSESDEPLFEMPHEEPELNFDKSDHEFSPESDLENGEPVEPMKRARTLQEEQDEGFCKRCGSGEQPEWILLCDRCDTGYHASCLKPMLFLIPEGDWFCPQCNHDRLIESLESELVKYDQLVKLVEAERARKQVEEPQPENEEEKTAAKEDIKEKSDSDDSASSGWSSSSSEQGAVYRLRARKQLPVSYRSREYDRLISTAIKEEYVEPTTSAGNQGRGKDISTIIEAAEEEKMKAIEREAIEQGKPLEAKKIKKKQRRKPRKLNSLDVPSEDDDETDEDFKDTGMESSSEEISSSAERESSNDSRSSDSLPIRRTCRSDKKERPTMAESSPEVKKKKKGVFGDSSSESTGVKDWAVEKKMKKAKSSHKKRDRSKRKRRHRSGLTQYDAEGNVVRARVTYGGLSADEEPNDWSPKHRTRQKKINYTEMPNTESEEEMHKSSGKHMPDSSDEFKVSDSELSSGSDGGRPPARSELNETEAEETVANRHKALNDLIRKTAVVPLEKLPEDLTRAKTEELHAHLNAQAQEQVAINSRPLRGRGSRGGRGFRGGRGRRGRGASMGFAIGSEGSAAEAPTDDALAKLVGVKIKDLCQDITTPLRQNQAEREKKRLEREAKQAEKEARKLERLQKKEEKEKLKEQKAKEREEKRLAKLALQESKRIKREKSELQTGAPYGMPRPMRPMAPDMHRMNMYGNAPIPIRHQTDYHEQRFPATPRLQVRPELRRADAPPDALRDGTLSVAGSPQPFKPVAEEPSIITRMPHMISQQYRGPMMYRGNNPTYGPRPPQNVMYPPHHLGARGQYQPSGYYPPPPYPPRPQLAPASSPGPQPRVSPATISGSPIPHYRSQPPPGLQRPPMGQFGPHGPSPMAGIPARPPSGPPQAIPSPRSTPPATSNPSEAPVYRAQPPIGLPRPPMGQFAPRMPPGLMPGPPVRPPQGDSVIASPSPVPPVVSSPPVQIKAEVKTEPEYRSPVSSPAPPSPPAAPHEPPRHPKIKLVENKDRRPRHPLGPYAPHYGPYGPYAPGPGPPPERPRPPFGPPPYHLQRQPYPQYSPESLRPMEQPRSPSQRPPGPAPERLSTAGPPESYLPYQPENLRPPERLRSPAQRLPGPAPERLPVVAPSESFIPPHLRPPARQPSPYGPNTRYPPEASNPSSFPSPPFAENSGRGPAGRGFTPHAVQRLLAEPSAEPAGEEAASREEGGVFGGLVSYFSSQHEDDMDA